MKPCRLWAAPITQDGRRQAFDRMGAAAMVYSVRRHQRSRMVEAVLVAGERWVEDRGARA